jgi:hypothetical protein
MSVFVCMCVVPPHRDDVSVASSVEISVMPRGHRCPEWDRNTAAIMPIVRLIMMCAESTLRDNWVNEREIGKGRGKAEGERTGQLKIQAKIRNANKQYCN